MQRLWMGGEVALFCLIAQACSPGTDPGDSPKAKTTASAMKRRSGAARAPVAPAPEVADASGMTAEDAAASGIGDLTYEMTGHIDAGQELQNCLAVQLPTDQGTIAINSAESHYTPGSHHFLVYRTGQTTLNEADASAHLCTVTEQTIHLDGTYYEAQAPDSHRDLPPGIAHVFQPGEVLLFTSHYLNTTEDDLDAKVTFILHTMDPAKVEQEAGSIFFYNPAISIAGSSIATVTRSCPIAADIHLALLWSHMHSRGVSFMASTDDQTAADRVGALYETTQWSEPSPRQFPYDPPVTVHAGSAITYSCTYENTTDHTIVQGQSAQTNEMCILHGMYWPRTDLQTEQCFQGTSSTSDPTPIQ
jgi:hypothetical protein